MIAAPDDPAALESLLRRYWGPIYAYVRRSGHSKDAAADLTQDFVASVLIQRDLIRAADPDRGRFRTFLKAALRNFLIDHRRRADPSPRDGGPITGLPLAAFEPSEADDPSHAFDRQWATTVLTDSLDRLEADCLGCGQGAHWAIFQAAVIRPALGHSCPTALDQLAREFGLEGPERASVFIQTVRRKFRRILLQVVQETVEDRALAEQEIGSLRDFLTL